jgi:Nicotianamine synthase protein
MDAELGRVRALCSVLGVCAESMDSLRAAHPVESARTTSCDGDGSLWGGTVGNEAPKVNGEYYWFEHIEPVYAELDELIRYASPELHANVFADDEIRALAPGIHRVRAAYERDRELIEARNLVAADDGRARLASTIEHERYWALGDELREVLGDRRRILVAGSGPLPLTALCIGATLEVHVTCVERDAECHRLGRQLIGMSRHRERFDCINADILDLTEFDQFDAIVGVVLLGVDTQGNKASTKGAIARHIIAHMSPGARMLLRDPHGLGKLLYPSLDLQSSADVRVTRLVPEVGATRPYRSGLVVAERCRPDGGHAH